ncbi:MAG: TGS domain-containing protein [Deltaproteobacteria bacterium]|nr:TGS domain-containing protein [Deltaproteobacteria bacterium]
MPANLPPHYFEAEKRYRDAQSPEDKVAALEEMLTIMPKHKGTDKLRADIRRRISKVKSQPKQKKGTSRWESDYSIDKGGAAQLAVIGPPNVGKSALVATLTNASPEVADFPHSSWKPTPGMAPYENIQFQLIDTPPMSEEFIDPLMADLIRRTDILLVMLDLQADPIQQYEDTLSILGEWRVFLVGMPVPEDLKKVPFIKKALIAANKMDEVENEEDFQVFLELSGLKLPCLGISTKTKRNLKELLLQIYDIAGIIRVYSKAPGKEPDMHSPFVLPKGSTLETLAAKIHKDFASKLKYARMWGKDVFDGQMVQRDYVLQEGDTAEIHL